MGYKMNGFSGFGNSPMKQKQHVKSEKEGKGKYHYKKAQHPKKQSPPEDEGLEVIKTNKRERISDIEDRISFLEEDVHAGNRTKAEVSPMIEKLKVALVKARK